MSKVYRLHCTSNSFIMEFSFVRRMHLCIHKIWSVFNRNLWKINKQMFSCFPFHLYDSRAIKITNFKLTFLLFLPDSCSLMSMFVCWCLLSDCCVHFHVHFFLHIWFLPRFFLLFFLFVFISVSVSVPFHLNSLVFLCHSVARRSLSQIKYINIYKWNFFALCLKVFYSFYVSIFCSATPYNAADNAHCSKCLHLFLIKKLSGRCIDLCKTKKFRATIKTYLALVQLCVSMCAVEIVWKYRNNKIHWTKGHLLRMCAIVCVRPSGIRSSKAATTLASHILTFIYANW